MAEFYDVKTWYKLQPEFFVSQLLPSLIRFVQFNTKKSLEQQNLSYEFLGNFIELVLDLHHKLQNGVVTKLSDEQIYKNDGFLSLAGINLYRNGQLKTQIRFPWPEEKGYFIYTGIPYVWVLELDDDPFYIDDVSLRLHLGGIKYNLLTNKVESKKFKTPLLLAYGQDKVNELVPELRLVPESKHTTQLSKLLESKNYVKKGIIKIKRNENAKNFFVYIHRKAIDNPLPFVEAFLKLGQYTELEVPTIELPWEVITMLAYQIGLVDEENLHNFPKDYSQIQEVARYSFALASLADIYRDFDPTDVRVRRVVSYQFFLARELEKVLYSFVRKQVSKFTVHTNLTTKLVLHRCFNYEVQPNPWSVIRLKTTSRLAYEISEKQHQISLTQYGIFCPVDTPDKEPGQLLRLTPNAKLSLLGKFERSFLYKNLPELVSKRLQYYNLRPEDVPAIPFDEEDLVYF